ncbi:MAG: MarR family transcriptional regulator [Sneathiella sp.]
MTLELEDFLPYRFNRLADILSKKASVVYRKEYGLTRPEWRTFALLGQKGRLTATEISRYSTLQKTKVSRAVYALEQRRWLVREQDEKDRRIDNLSLTPQGKKAYCRLVPLMMENEQEMTRRLGKANHNALRKGLEALERLYILSDDPAAAERKPDDGET